MKKIILIFVLISNFVFAQQKNKTNVPIIKSKPKTNVPIIKENASTNVPVLTDADELLDVKATSQIQMIC